MVKKKSVDLKLINGLECEESHKHYTNSLQEVLLLHNLDCIDGELYWEGNHIFRGKTKRALGEKTHPKRRVWARN